MNPAIDTVDAAWAIAYPNNVLFYKSFLSDKHFLLRKEKVCSLTTSLFLNLFEGNNKKLVVNLFNIFYTFQKKMDIHDLVSQTQERCAIPCTCTYTNAKAFRSAINRTCKSNCVWSRYVPNVMLLLNRRLSLITRLKLAIRVLTRKLQSGPNWESEHSEHACISIPKYSWGFWGLLWVPPLPSRVLRESSHLEKILRPETASRLT